MPVIQIDNVSKSYRLGAIGGGTLREDVSRWWARFRGRPDPSLKIGQEQRAQSNEQGAESAEHEARSTKHEARSTKHGHSSPTDAPPTDAPTHRHTDLFWALRNISLEVKEGEILGIIGRNGAGKSTLLKILSRVTGPTEGEVRLRGRVASLLEVGTGFHPELTGRENVFLNGAVLGMTKSEIRRKFDEIVDFAGIDQFIDTPVKRYSSGMYVRLAFGVAAHLDPEILILDEVLAVGDAVFQKKCLGKMGSVAREGRTVLFVSHNLAAVNSLCSRVILLNNGRQIMEGDARTVTERYLQSGGEDPSEAPERTWDMRDAPGDEVTRLKAFRVVNELGETAYDHDIGNRISLEVDFWLLQPHQDISCSFHLHNQEGTCLFVMGADVDPDCQGEGRLLSPGVYRGACHIPANFLNDGVHSASVCVIQYKTRWETGAQRAISFCTHDYGDLRGGYLGKMIGAIRPALPWTTQRLGDLS
jgi:lipopolysaccharide transport system ATP-binding protein